MGYRSEWRIAAHGKPTAIKKLVKWLETTKWSTTEDPGGFSEAHLAEVMLHEKKISEDGKSLLLGSDYTKCYPPWDSMVAKLLAYGRETLKLDISYGRLGEDPDDSEFDNGEQFHISYVRQFTEQVEFPDGSSL